MVTIFDWLGEIISGVGESLGGFFSEHLSNAIWDMMLQWLYNTVFGAIADFFTYIGEMGAEIFTLSWVDAVVKLFSYFGWALFVTGLVVAVFDTAIEAQNGRSSIRDTAINCIKGFMAVNLFTIVPIELYKFCVSLQNTLSKGLANLFASEQTVDVGKLAIKILTGTFKWDLQVKGLFMLLMMIAFAYCVIKVFFANIKRGGILLVQIAVGSLYMFSVPRGYMDGFMSWCKQIFGLCLTAFLQTTLLFLGLLTFEKNMILGLGIMLASTEIPRIAGQFGLDTSTKGNMMSAVYATQSVVNMTKSVVKAGA